MNSIQDIQRFHIENMYYPFYGSFAQQTPQAFIAINNLLNAFDFSTIIEVGSHSFGLSTFLALYCCNSKMLQQSPEDHGLNFKNYLHHKNPKDFITYDIDIKDSNALKIIEALSGKFRQRDIFKDEENLKKDIKRKGKTLVLCDGGNKIKEFKYIAPFLKTGDILMAHDYMENEDVKLKCLNKEWGSCEIMDKDVKEELELYNLIPIYKEIFDSVFWLCVTKGN